MKPTSKAKAMLFIISKINMIAETIISPRSVGTRFKAIRTLVLVILFTAGVVASANADRHGANLHVVSSPQIDGELLATAAIAANDIWAVGFSDQVPAPPVVDSTLAEPFNGTSWKIINSPNPGNFQNGLFGATALSDGTVAAVGFQQDQGLDKIPLILQN